MDKNHVVPLHVNGRCLRRRPAVVKDVKTDREPIDRARAFLAKGGIVEVTKEDAHSVGPAAAADMETEINLEPADRFAVAEIIDNRSSVHAANAGFGEFQHVGGVRAARCIGFELCHTKEIDACRSATTEVSGKCSR